LDDGLDAKPGEPRQFGGYDSDALFTGLKFFWYYELHGPPSKEETLHQVTGLLVIWQLKQYCDRHPPPK
jgi:hypothetical protein